MTEAEWNACTDPYEMLRVLRKGGGPALAGEPFQVTDRKLRLFACACCRCAGVPNAMVDRWEETGNPVEDDTSWANYWSRINYSGDDPPTPTLRAALLRDIVNPWWQLPGEVCEVCEHGSGPVVRKASICSFCGNTGRIPPPWVTARVREFAETMYRERDFSGAAVLADLLETEGCPLSVRCERCRGTSIVKRMKKEMEFLYPDDDFKGCPDCCATGSVPNPLLQHLRQDGGACPYCVDLDPRRRDGSKPPPDIDRYHRSQCACKGARRLPAVHVRGCFCLDYLTERS